MKKKTKLKQGDERSEILVSDKTVGPIKIIVEKHPDTYIAYPLGIRGSCVSQGDTYEEALAEVKVMLKGYIETFGPDIFEDRESPVMEAFVAETLIGA